MEGNRKKLTIKDIGMPRLGLMMFAGVVLVVCSLPFGNKQSKQEEAKTTSSLEEDGYEVYLEQRVTSLLKQMEGVGEVSVMITLERDWRKVLERDIEFESKNTKEQDANGGSREVLEYRENNSILLTEDENGRQVPIIITEEMPIVKGIAVVASGGGDALIKNQISSLLATLFHLEANQISVNQMEQDYEN